MTDAENAAATAIQSAFRGYQVRRDIVNRHGYTHRLPRPSYRALNHISRFYGNLGGDNAERWQNFRRFRDWRLGHARRQILAGVENPSEVRLDNGRLIYRTMTSPLDLNYIGREAMHNRNQAYQRIRDYNSRGRTGWSEARLNDEGNRSRGELNLNNVQFLGRAREDALALSNPGGFIGVVRGEPGEQHVGHRSPMTVIRDHGNRLRAAERIERAYMNYMARRDINRLRTRRRLAASRIQGLARGRGVRRSLGREAAATQLQRVFRGHYLRRELDAVIRDFNDRAARIQAAYRGYRVRRGDLPYTVARRRAATRIQALARGSGIRSVIARNRARGVRRAAATSIQSAFRGYRSAGQTRRLAPYYRALNTGNQAMRLQAAQTLQRYGRGFLYRRLVNEARPLLEDMRAKRETGSRRRDYVGRLPRARTYGLTRSRAAIRLQALARGRDARFTAAMMRATTAAVSNKRKRDAATRIQALARGRDGRFTAAMMRSFNASGRDALHKRKYDRLLRVEQMRVAKRPRRMWVDGYPG